MRKLMGIVAVLATTLPAASASACSLSGGSIPGSPGQVYTVGVHPAAVYIVDNNWQREFWVYAETNGIPGLQRGSRSAGIEGIFGGQQDSCIQSANPDTAIA